MDPLLSRKCLEVLHVSSVSDFSRRLIEFSQSLGFGTVAATVITDHSPTLTEFQSVTNVPTGYLADFRDLDSAKFDPVSQHCKHSSAPIVWDQKLYVTSGRENSWEHQAAFGLRSGVSVAFHLPRGRHFLFGADSNESACGNGHRLRNLVEEIHWFASYAQAAAFDLCNPYDRRSDRTSLAKGELDALQWSTDGLTDWEIGSKMGLSATDVTLRIRRAVHKLGCTNRYETALRAVRLGLVNCA
jgi:DNA-binding CsgD family transcriptional regulator